MASRTKMVGFRRTKKVQFGVVLVLAGLLLTYNGLVALFNSPFGDYNMTAPLTIDTSSRAVVTNDVELLRGHYGRNTGLATLVWYRFLSPPDEGRAQGVGAGSDPLFMGVAPADAVAGYLDGVNHNELTEWDLLLFDDEFDEVVYVWNEGTTNPAAPGTKGFWVASVSGSGEQTLDWTIQSGEWAVVIMNADGSPGVSADVRFGAQPPSGLVPLGWTSVAAGLVALIGGARLVYRGQRYRGTPPPPNPTETAQLTQETGTPA